MWLRARQSCCSERFADRLVLLCFISGRRSEDAAGETGSVEKRPCGLEALRIVAIIQAVDPNAAIG